MDLGFSQEFSDGEKTYFEQKIFSSLEGIEYNVKEFKAKHHTIREDKSDRWRKGEYIKFCYNQLTIEKRIFNTGICTGTQRIQIYYTRNGIQIKEEPIETDILNIRIDGRELLEFEIVIFARNDGFPDIKQFRNWFNKPTFIGKIIHWTQIKY